MHKKREHFGYQPVYDVGLYFSSRTRDWIGRENAAAYFQSFQGAHRACVLEHLQFGVLLDENVALARLHQFPIVCLPNAAILLEREVELLRKYVESGGQLIVTGHSGQFDRWGEPLADSVLSELIGAKVTRRLDSHDNWVSFGRASGTSEEATRSSTLMRLSDGIRWDWPFLVEGPATVYRPTAAQTVGELLKPHRTARQLQGKMGTEWPMSADAPVGPGMLVNQVGKGTVLTFAASPDFATASEHAIVEARMLLRNAIRLLRPAPRIRVSGCDFGAPCAHVSKRTTRAQRNEGTFPCGLRASRIRVSAPANVEVVVTDAPEQRTLRVHFIAYNATPQTTPNKNRPFILPGLIEDKPIFRATMELADKLRRVEAVSPSTEVHHDGHKVEVTIDDIHEVLALEY